MPARDDRRTEGAANAVKADMVSGCDRAGMCLWRRCVVAARDRRRQLTLTDACKAPAMRAIKIPMDGNPCALRTRKDGNAGCL